MSVPETCELYMRAGNVQVYVCVCERTQDVRCVCVCFLLAVKCLRGGRACVRALLQICQWEGAAQGLVECVCVWGCGWVCAGLGLFPQREGERVKPALSVSKELPFIWVYASCVYLGGPWKERLWTFWKQEARWTFSSEKKRLSGWGKVCV